MKFANLILKVNGNAFLHSSSITNVNLLLATGPQLSISNWKDLPAEEKLSYLNEVLKGSVQNIPWPAKADREKGDEIFLKNFGFSTWSELYKKTKMCYIRFHDRIFTFIPAVYDSRRGSHEATSDKLVKISSDIEAQKIIDTLESALIHAL